VLIGEVEQAERWITVALHVAKAIPDTYRGHRPRATKSANDVVAES
jgi:hypothetical protein